MEEKTCFLLTPLGMPGTEVRERSDRIFRYVVQPAVQQSGYSLQRADHITAPGPISSQVVQHILEANLIVADLTGVNPNVMYELGVAHSARKPVIQISTDSSRLPFDVAGMRTIIVDTNSENSLIRAKHQLLEAITSVGEMTDSFESPVSAAADVQSFQQRRGTLPSPEEDKQSPILNILKDIENRLKSVEYNVSQLTKPAEQTKKYSRRVFIVHGHDGELKNELARLLERLDFEPIILHEQPDKGQTIFSKLNGELSDIGFAFVILTPDDMGTVASNPQDPKPRARQNVVFEHGLFAGHLKPERVCAIRRGDVEVPSDLYGVLYKTITAGNSIRSISLEVANELRAAGYVVDANKIL